MRFSGMRGGYCVEWPEPEEVEADEVWDTDVTMKQVLRHLGEIDD